MTIKLSELRVVAGMDPTRYVAGMQKKIAADKAGAASSAQVGAAVQRTDGKLSVAGSVMERLERRYVAGAREAQMFHRGLNALSKGIETGNIPMMRAEAILEGMYQKYGLTANAAEIMERGQVHLAQTVTAVNARLEQQEAAADGTAGAMTRLGAASRMARFQQNQLRLQMFDVVQMLALGQNPIMTLMQQGPQIAQIYGSQEGGVTRAFREMGKSIVGAARAHPALAAAAVVTGVAFAGLTYEINRASDVSVGFGDTLMAVLHVVGHGIATVLQPAFAAIAPYAQMVWDGIVAGVKFVGNLIINSFRAAFADVKLVVGGIAVLFQGAYDQIIVVWNGLPAALGSLVYGAADRVVAGIEAMINGSVERINALRGMLPDWAREWVPEMGGVDLGGIENPYAGAAAGLTGQMAGVRSGVAADLKALLGQRNADVAGIMSSDPLGELFDAVKAQAVANALKDVEDNAGSAGDALKKAANDNKKPWGDLSKELEKMKSALGEAGQGFGGVLKGLIDGTMDWKDALMQAGVVLLKLLNDMNLAGGGSGLFGGGFLQGIIGGILGIGWANGGVFDRGNVIPFARGGVVSRPTLFPMANGAGLMGEAGPEAIMPLRRGADGRLGVSAANQNAGPQRIDLYVHAEEGEMFRPTIRTEAEGVAVRVTQGGLAQYDRSLPSRVGEVMERQAG